MSYLLDANVLSELTRTEPNAEVLQWFTGKVANHLWVSVITLGEIERGILLLPDGRRKQNLVSWFERLRERFAGQILEIQAPTMRIWAQLYSSPEFKVGVRGGLDSLIAATAIQHDLTLATRNVKDFPSSVPVVNPWR